MSTCNLSSLVLAVLSSSLRMRPYGGLSPCQAWLEDGDYLASWCPLKLSAYCTSYKTGTSFWVCFGLVTLSFCSDFIWLHCPYSSGLLLGLQSNCVIVIHIKFRIKTTGDHFTNMDNILILACIANHIPSDMSDKNAYAFQTSTVRPLKFEWISNLITLYTGCIYLFMLGLN